MSNIHLGLPYPGGVVDHSSNLANDIGVLYLNDEYSDVTLQVNGQAFHAHKVILAARSQYFRWGKEEAGWKAEAVAVYVIVARECKRNVFLACSFTIIYFFDWLLWNKELGVPLFKMKEVMDRIIKVCMFFCLEFYYQFMPFFRALLFGGLRESHQAEVEIKDTNLTAFKVLLKYIYTGWVSLGSEKVSSGKVVFLVWLVQ